MSRQLPILFCVLIAGALFDGNLPSPVAAAEPGFTRLQKLAPPRIVSSAPAYPGKFEAANVFDGDRGTEYASNGRGTNTFIEVDFGKAVRLAGFEHIERNDPATISTSELLFLDSEGKPVGRFPIRHLNERAGVTRIVFTNVVTATRARWQVTELGSGLATVGAAELAFFTVGNSEPWPTATSLSAALIQLREKTKDGEVQPLRVQVEYPYIEALDATLEVEGSESKQVHLTAGTQSVEVTVPAVDSEKELHLNLRAQGKPVVSTTTIIRPVRPWEIFLLPHSHVDIGYTALQADVEAKQNSNIETGLRLARETADYPADAQFKWNVEVLWPVENYLRDCSPEKREALIAAVRSGQVGLDAFYCNILTGLCRPEELLNLMSYATRVSKVCGVPIDSAMISDVPGYTWSTVSAMTQAGVKYFSFAPNYFDRMGSTMKEWQNKPFWWQGPDGKSRVLCWCPSRGYALGHLIGEGAALARFIPEYLKELETNAYPYDLTYLRWNVHGDNGSPDEHLSEVVRDWNSHYVYPHLAIRTTSVAFHEFERRYGNKLPVYSGDYTPYWEDGAGSSARATGLNRASAERLTQAETLWSIRGETNFPVAEFQAAWRDVLLYSEHTWGAHNSIREPDLPFVREQWEVKQGFALGADRKSKDLLNRAAGAIASDEVPGELDVYNTSSWPRTDLVTVPPELAALGDAVQDETGRPVPAQRLSGGELVFLASNVPGLGAARFRIRTDSQPLRGGARTEPARLISSDFFVRVDERTGAIKYLFSRKAGRELVDTNSATELNDYFYLPGSEPAGAQRNGPPRISAKENGPLVASLLIESSAPGCRGLTREVRVVNGLNRVDFIDTVDKLPVRAKEGVHIGFGFGVPKGIMRMDVGWAVIRPEVDQIPAACKNWFSVQRWVDVSNSRFGVTWSPVDSPLVEVGGLTANLLGSQTDYRAWIQHLAPSQTVYAWAMNNHWHTNYRADQEGLVNFRFSDRK